MARGKDCQVHTHDTLVPQEKHHVWPLGYHGPNVKSNLIMLCANGHGDAHYLLEAMLKTGKSTVEEAYAQLGWEYVRTYGIKTRAVSVRGFEQVIAYGEQIAKGIENAAA